VAGKKGEKNRCAFLMGYVECEVRTRTGKLVAKAAKHLLKHKSIRKATGEGRRVTNPSGPDSFEDFQKLDIRVAGS